MTRPWQGAITAALWVWLETAQGAVSLSGTRLVFDGRYVEASIEARNRGDREVLLQVWPTDGLQENDAPDAPLPFVVTPHLLHLPGHGREQLRVLYQGQGMPTDRESLLHLYALEIPRRAQGSQQLNIALRQRINVFYRPKDLPGDPALTPQALQWLRHADGVLQLRNPTPFYATLQDIRVNGVQLSDYLLLAPGAGQDWPLPDARAAATLSFKALNDYGGQLGYCTRLARSTAATAQPLAQDTFQTLQHNKEQC